MNYTSLSLNQSPGIWSPLRFFISAPLFAILAAILLMLSGSEILQNRWLPQTLAITHLLALGFITMVMMGAMFQLLPVLAGSAIYKSKISSKIIHFLMAVGVLLFCFGFYTDKALFIKLSLFFIVPAMLVFLILVSIALYQSRSTFASANGMRFSVSALWISLMLGGILAVGNAWSDIPLLREFTPLHVIWAVLGWVLTMVFAVAFQVIPMFQVTNEYSKSIQTYFFSLFFAGLFLVSVQVYLGFSTDIVFFILSLLLVVFSVISIKLLLKRKKRLVDASFYYWITGFGSLMLCVVIFNIDMLLVLNLDMLIGFLFFVGFVISVINGMLFKIVPFLIWLHLNKKLAFSGKGLSAVPTMNEIISRKKMLRQYVLHVAALILTLLSFFIPAVIFQLAMLIWLMSFSLLFWYLLQAVKLYDTCIKEVEC